MNVGDLVRLKPGIFVGVVPEGRMNHRTARVRALLSDIDGGVYTDRDLRGARYWHVEDVVVVAADAAPGAATPARRRQKRPPRHPEPAALGHP